MRAILSAVGADIIRPNPSLFLAVPVKGTSCVPWGCGRLIAAPTDYDIDGEKWALCKL